MGLFSGKKKTFVSSSVWNLAGDIKDRPDYLKSVVVGNVIMDNGYSLGEVIPSSYLNGPGMGLRRYGNWARGSSNYANDVGFVGGGVVGGNSVNNEELANELPRQNNERANPLIVEIGFADSDWWADEYMVTNHPDLLFTDWYGELLSDNTSIRITFQSGSTVTFPIAGFDPTARYIAVVYQTISPGAFGSIVIGSEVTVPTFNDLPSTGGYTKAFDVDTTVSLSLTKTTRVQVTYSDGRPGSDTTTPTPRNVSVVNKDVVYNKYTITPLLLTKLNIYNQYVRWTAKEMSPVTTTTTESIGGGVTKTTVTTITDQEPGGIYKYRMDYQTAPGNNVSGYKYFRYKEGSGNPVLDAMFVAPVGVGEFLPFIPIRINNVFLRDSDPVTYSKTVRATKKALGGAKLDEILSSIETNDQIGDLDFVYAVFGASLNSPERAAIRYIYDFFKLASDTNPDAYVKFLQWEIQWEEARQSAIAFNQWESGSQTTTAPLVLPYPPLPRVSVDVSSTSGYMNFNMSVSFNGARPIDGIGLLPGRKVGDAWIEASPSREYDQVATNNSSVSGQITTNTVEAHTIYVQVSANRWVGIELYGIEHRNYVYDGKWVVIKASEALNDPEESGFIIPIHEETFKKMRLIDSTQMSTSCCYLMFNCYKEVKQKWYQTSLFKVLLVVASIVVTVVFPPAGGATGVLGSSVSVGTSLGFTGTAALVAGVTANAIAAIVITKALSTAFGDKIGSILGAAVTVLLSGYGGVSNFDFNSASLVTELTKATNLIAISNGLVGSVSAYMQEKTQDILDETNQLMARYKTDMMEVASRYDEMFGAGARGVIDPLMLTDSTVSGYVDPPDAFMERTLMCGSDVARLSNELVTRFADVSIKLDLP